MGLLALMAEPQWVKQKNPKLEPMHHGFLSIQGTCSRQLQPLFKLVTVYNLFVQYLRMVSVIEMWIELIMEAPNNMLSDLFHIMFIIGIVYMPYSYVPCVALHYASKDILTTF